MIWVITNIAEDDGTFPTYRQYSEVIGRDNIRIYRATTEDTFDFICNTDTVLLRTLDKTINQHLLQRKASVHFKSTLEPLEVIANSRNKVTTKQLLKKADVPVPATHFADEITNGKQYFVKPVLGEDSKLIDEQSICNTKQQVVKKANAILAAGDFPLIEEYIDGYDYTCAVIRTAYGIKAYPIEIKNTGEQGNIQTHKSKMAVQEECTAIQDKTLEDYAIKAFNAIGATHYMRIDFRGKNGDYKCIDCNLLPSLGLYHHLAICVMKNAHVGYDTVMKMVLNSAD